MSKYFSGVFPRGLFPASEETSTWPPGDNDGVPLNQILDEELTKETPVISTEEASDNLDKGIKT